MSGQLHVEAFGKLDQGAYEGSLILEDGIEELFLGVFEDQAEILGWSTGWSKRTDGRPEPLWGAHEAELITAGDGDGRIGFANVSVGFGPPAPSKPTPPPPPGGKHYANRGWHRRSWDPAFVLPALIQCFYDALRRFGAVELTGIQVFGISFDPRTDRFRSTPNWFNVGPAEEANAIIAFDKGLFGGRVEPQTIVERLTVTTEPFRFGPMVDLSEEYSLSQTGEQ